MSSTPTLTYLYGPPAVGKLAVATELAAHTGHGLCHNHLTVDALLPLFEFRSPEFTNVLHRLRLDIFATAMGAGINVIFTNNSAWGGADARQRFQDFVEVVSNVVTRAGGTMVLVQLTASAEALEARINDPSRHQHQKLTDVIRLREILAEHDPTPLPGTALVVDTTTMPPHVTAAQIAVETAAT